MDIVESKVTDEDPLTIFEEAMDKVRPKVEVKSQRVGGATYQVPMEVRQVRRNALAIRWIISFAKARSGKSMSEKLAAELLDAYNDRGAAVKNVTIPIVWLKPIRPLPTTAGRWIGTSLNHLVVLAEKLV